MEVEIKTDSNLNDIKVIILAPEITEEVQELISRLNKTDSMLTGFRKDEIKLIEPSSVIRIYSAKQNVYAVCKDGEYQLRYRLYKLETHLKSYGFIRISNSEIINLKKVQSFDLSISGTICVIFKDGSSTYASRRYVSIIKKTLGI